LGFVHDYFDDIVIAAPTVLATPSVVAIGGHAEALAHVEIGHTCVPADYTMLRADVDEVFRTLVAEPRNTRLANPGLDAGQVDTVIGVLCIVLAIMRRLDLGEIAIHAV
jgi:exopolyphosphatase/pppGpp-phosphohydrolase